MNRGGFSFAVRNRYIYKMNIKVAKELSLSQKEAVLRIWNDEYAEKLVKTMPGFEEYLSKLGRVQHFLMFDDAVRLGGDV